MKTRTAWIAVAAILACLLSTGNLLAKDLWDWSPKADHHFAVVKVKIKGARGSGALIHIDEKGTGYILTAAHVVRTSSDGKAWAEWTNGYQSGGQITHISTDSDCAVFICKPPENAVVIPVATAEPQPGEKLEVCGYGGPDLGIRHFFVKSRQQSNREWSVCDGTVLPGDSGGPILTTGDSVSVVGLACNGFNVGSQVFEGERTDVVQPIRGPGVKWIDQFLEVACPGGMCENGPRVTPFGGRLSGGGRSRPPADSGPREEPYVPPTKAPTPAPKIDTEKEALKSRLKALEDALAKAGNSNAKECECDSSRLESKLSESLADMEAKNKKLRDELMKDNLDVKNRIAQVENTVLEFGTKVVSSGKDCVTKADLEAAIAKLIADQATKPQPQPPPVVDTTKGDPSNRTFIYVTVKGAFPAIDKEVQRRIEDGYNIRQVVLSPQEIPNVASMPRFSKFPNPAHYVGEADVKSALAGLVK